MDLGLIVSIASLGLDLFDRLKHPGLLTKINTAYQAALKKWCRNEDIRQRIASKFLSFEALVSYIQQQDNKKIPQEYGSFLKDWEAELRNDSDTYLFLQETLSRHTIDLSQKIYGTLCDTQNQVGQGFAKTHELLIEVKDEIHKLDKPNIYANRKYEQPKNYIRRTVRDYVAIDSFQHLLSPDSYRPLPLIDYVLRYKNIVLYSEAQEGKSTELQNLAYETQNSDLFHVVFFDLRYYNEQTLLLQELPFDYLTTGSSKRGILILDGLDEIKDDTRAQAILQIEQIASLYFDLYIVVSCRGNFENTNSIEGFKKLYLNPLGPGDVETYLRKHCFCPDKLLAHIQQKELYELAYNPFYLKSILKYFEQNQTLPDTKSAIYDYVIDESFDIDQKRAKGGVIAVKEEAILLLQKVAFCLQFSERQFFDLGHLHSEIGLSHEEIEKCCNYTIFKKNSANHYTFTHNAFREYLTAKRLAGTAFELLKNAICYPETEILRPNLYNTILLLIGILDKESPLLKSLIEWLANENPKVLFMCEKHFLNDKRCTEVFQAYYDHLGRCEEYIELLKCKRIMQFANNRNTILYLYEKVEQNPDISTNLSNAVSLLQYADLTLLNQQELKEFVKTAFALLDHYKDDRDYISRIFDIFRNSYFHTPELIQKIHDAVRDSENPILLNEFFGIIENAELADEYIDWILDRRKYICEYVANGATRIVDKDQLVNILISVNRIDHVIRVLSIVEEYIESSFFEDRRSTIYVLLFEKLQQQITDFTEQHLDQLVKYLMSDSLFVNKNQLIVSNACRSFLIKNGYDEPLFKQYYATLKETLKSSCQDDYFWSCLNVASTLMTDIRFEQIEQDTDLTEEQRGTIIVCLRNYSIIAENPKWSERIQIWQDRYFPKRIDLQKSAQDGFDILFDYERFNTAINDVAQSHETLTKRCYSVLSQERVNESVSAFIGDYELWSDPIKVFMKDVVDAVQNIDKFKLFKLQRLEYYTRAKISVTDKQKDQISEFVATCIDTNAGDNNIRALISIISSYEIKLSDEKLLSLLPYSIQQVNNDFNIGIYESYDNLFLKYIETHISDKNLLTSEIENIIKNDLYFSMGLYQKLTLYIMQNRLNKLYVYFEPILFHAINEQYSTRSFQSAIIDIILQLGNDGFRRLETFKDRFDSIVKIGYYDDVLMNEDLTPDNNEIETDLLSMYKTIAEDYKGDVLALLLRIGSIDGLGLFVNYYSSNKLELHFFKPSFERYDSAQIDRIKQIFELNSPTDGDIIGSIHNSAFIWLNNWALESKDNNDNIIDYYRRLADSDSGKYRYLRFYASRIRNKFYEIKSPTMSIMEACSFYDQVA